MYEMQIDKIISLFQQSSLILTIISVLIITSSLIILYFRRQCTTRFHNEKNRMKKSELILQERVKQLEVLLNNLPDPVVYRNGNGEYEWVNQELSSLWGIPAAKIVKSRPEELFPGGVEEQKKIDSLLRSRNRPLVKERKYTDPSGETKSYEVTYKQIVEPFSSRMGILETYKDISHYRDQLEILNDLYVSVREDLQKRSDYYAEFLRTSTPPLHLIMRESEALLPRNDLDDEIKDRLARIVSSGQEMNSHIRNLSFLAFPDKISALYESGSHRSEDESLTLEDWQNQLVQRVSAFCREKDLPVFVLLQGDIPESLDTRFPLLNELLERLIENAETLSWGGYYLIIRVNRVEVGFFTMNITIRNTGPAIEASRREDIFKPFTRIIREGKGSGLGLTVARSLAEKMGGSLSCDPSCPDGARFLLSLPPVKGRGTVISGSRLGGCPGRERHKVLLADIDESLRQKLAHQLSGTGYTVDLAATGEEALVLMKNQAYDLILLDQSLTSGISLSDFRKGRLYLLKPSGEENDFQPGSDEPFHFIEKPVNWNQLLDLLIQPVSDEKQAVKYKKTVDNK